MSILLVILFGSRARGDAEEGSDTDLLFMTPGAGIRHVSEGNLSLSFYGENELNEGAASGDLFVCHLVKEGRVLAGNTNQFEALRRTFCLRDDYSDVISKASDLGRFLIKHGSRLRNDRLVNRRLAWVARTILIARSAEGGNAVFSAKALADWARMSEIEPLVSKRYSVRPEPDAFSQLERLIDRWGARPAPSDLRSMQAFRRHFAATNNSVALRTISDLRRPSLSPEYGN